MKPVKREISKLFILSDSVKIGHVSNIKEQNEYLTTLPVRKKMNSKMENIYIDKVKNYMICWRVNSLRYAT